jgi:MFS family permease
VRSRPAEATPSWSSPAILFCIVGNLLLRLGNSATGVLMGLLLAAIDREGRDVPAVAVGLLAASFYATELVGAPWFGAQSDRRGPRPFMVAGPICGGIAVQLIGWPSILVGWPLLLVAMAVGRMIEGLSTATSAPATLSLLSSATASSPNLRARVMAWSEMATVLGIGGGFVVGGLLWDRLGHAAFAAVTLIYGLSLLSFLRVPRADGPHPARGAGRPAHLALLAVIRRPRVLRFAPAWLFVNTVVGVWFTHAAFQLTGEERAGQYLAGTFTGTSLGGVFALFGAAFMVGIFLWGLVIGARRKTSIMAITASGLYLVCVALFLINRLGHAGGSTLVLLTCLFLIAVAVASGFTPAALAYLADISEEGARRRGAVMGLYSVILGLGQLLGGALGGPFADFGGVDGLILLTGLLGTGAIATVLVLRRFEERSALLRSQA